MREIWPLERADGSGSTQTASDPPTRASGPISQTAGHYSRPAGAKNATKLRLTPLRGNSISPIE
jgi:hypothetical protein